MELLNKSPSTISSSSLSEISNDFLHLILSKSFCYVFTQYDSSLHRFSLEQLQKKKFQQLEVAVHISLENAWP